MQIPRINIEKSDLITLFRIYRKTIAYCLIAVVVYSIFDKAANNFATKPVIVASKDIAAGTILDEQLTNTRVLATAEKITDQRVVGVRIIDSEVASILKPGSLVDVVRISNSNGVFGGVIARDVSVVAIASKKSSFGASAGSVVMVSTNNDNAVNLAINSGEKLTVLLH